MIRPFSSKYASRVDLRPSSTLALCVLLETSGFLHRYTNVLPYAHNPLAISSRNARTHISTPTSTVPASTMGDSKEALIEGLGVSIRGVATAVLKRLGGAYCIIPLTTPRRFSRSGAMRVLQTPKRSFGVGWLSSC